MPTSDEVRQLFLDYFQSKEHHLMPSSSLIPATDPTLLFTSAGMVQFKPYFLGQSSPPARRLTSSQKCFRTTDIDTVGDYKHLTFFEMLGNFSVGDYFKKEAVAYAWEFVTKHMNLSPDQLYITIYSEDDEAFRLWNEDIGVPAGRIYRYGKSDNWWGPPGDEGPCGPCSELHYDFGEELGCQPMASPEAIAAWGGDGDQPGCHPNCERCGRFVELWNLVFMQFYQDLEKRLTDLPAPNIDTGMGLERAVVVLNGVRSVYDTDLFQPIIARVGGLAGVTYGQEQEKDYAIRVISEHARGATFLIADGVVPGNEGRGYVLRRIIRRAIRFSRKLGLTEPFLSQVSQVVIEKIGHVYPELTQNRDFILKVLQLEEERFGEVYENGRTLLESGLIAFRMASIRAANDALEMYGFAASVSPVVSEGGHTEPEDKLALVRNKGAGELGKALNAVRQAVGTHPLLEKTSNWFERLWWSLETRNTDDPQEALTTHIQRFTKAASSLSAQEAFVLHDTYGFPPELTEEIAKEHGLSVDMQGFEREMEAQRERARGAGRFGGEARTAFAYESLGVGATRFVGYERLHQESVVVALIAGGESVSRVESGQEIEIVLRETPFYAEGGGQVGDAGEIVCPSGKVIVEDTHSPISDLIAQRGRVVEGTVSLGEASEARVDSVRRLDTARNHTGTHLLHAALREVLGTHVRQAGSLVAPDRLRFDFSHVQPMSQEEILALERLVNEKIRQNLPVHKRESTYTQAVREGALAFFGDTYGEKIRVVEMGNGSTGPATGGRPFSMEVCGGTHLERTGDIGLCLVTSEQSIGSGMRRLEAVTGRAAEQLARERLDTLESLGHLLGTGPTEVSSRIIGLVEELEQEHQRAASLERRLLRTEVEAAENATTELEGVRLFTFRLEGATSLEALREAADWVRAKLGSAVITLGAVIEDQPVIFVAVAPDLVSKGLHAGNLARELGKVMDGGGGGRPESAQAGGKRKEKLNEALFQVPQLVNQMITQA